MREYGSGPAGAEPITPGHISVVLPEWILKNVGDHNRLSAVHGRAARPSLRSDAKTVDGLAVGLRKAGSSTVPHVFSILIEEQHRAKQAGKLRFHDAHQVFQRFLERCIASYHLQNAALSITQRLCPIALGNVHHGTHEFAGVAGRLDDRVTYPEHVSCRLFRNYYSEMRLDVSSCADCPLEIVHSPVPIFRMNALIKFIECRYPVSPRIETKQAMVFLRRVDHLSSRDVACPAACVA